MKKLTLSILTPSRAIIEKKEVDSVTLPAYDGEMCILPDHIPYMGQLKEGILKYKIGASEEYISIFWGFFEVLHNNVIVLAEDANISKEIDEERQRQEYQKLKQAIISKDKQYNIEDLELQLKKIIVNLKLSEKKKRHK